MTKSAVLGLAVLLAVPGCKRDCPEPTRSAATVPTAVPSPEPARGPMDLTRVAAPTVLGIDMVLMALIGPPGAPVERFIDMAAKGEMTPVILDLALHSAMSSIQPGDKVDHARFARLLQCAELRASMSRPEGGAFEPPAPEAIAHWRDVALGKQ